MTPSIQERLSLIDPLYYRNVWRAAAGAADETLDFSVLSVAVTTLGLILGVELLRHKLDVAAVGRPFFKTVLESVYRELATLGIVEFFIFLLHKYYKGLNVAQELVFADVHFALFFTAMFNAIQSAILAFFTRRNSNRLWVSTEYQDLHHYVEIREEFDRVEKRLLKLYLPDEQIDGNEGSRSIRKSLANRIWARATNDDSQWRYSLLSLQSVASLLVRSIRYPVLSARYRDLLVQVRFHELKFHFIQANQLPITMHVSDYLKRSELHILMKLVHISTFAWLLLTAGFNLVYFLLGVTAYTTDGNLNTVGNAMTGIFFATMIFFLLLSLLIWNKMEWIFHNIMHMKLISESGTVGPNNSSQSLTFGVIGPAGRASYVSEYGQRIDQKSLFWGSNPRYITMMIQFMQFGYAVALSVLLIFWNVIDTPGGVGAEWYLICALICYVLFVVIMSRVIPRFTLCTSLGQMVNQRRLHETLARHRLEEARRLREQKMLEQEFDNSFLKDDKDDSSKSLFGVKPPKVLQALQSIGQAVLPDNSQKVKASSRVSSRKEPVTPQLFQKLVNTDTKYLRSTLPQKEQEALSERDQRIQERRISRKTLTLSDGVYSMRALVGIGQEGDEETVGAAAPTVAPRRHQRKKSMSASASIRMMRDMTHARPELDEVELPVRAKDDSEVLAGERAKRRARRKKTLSASADIRMMRLATLKEELAPKGSIATAALSPSSSLHHVGEGSVAQILNQKPSEYVTLSPAQHADPSIPRTIHESYPLDPVQYQDRLLLSRDNTMVPFFGKQQEKSEPSAKPALEIVKAQNEASRLSFFGDPAPSPERAVAASPKDNARDDLQTETETEDGEGDDDCSDANDLPEVHESDRLFLKAGPPPRPSLDQIARRYFRGRRYVIVSSVFGTMICFFMVGMRLESVMIETGVLVNNGNTWHFDSRVSFWLEFSFLSSFVIVDFVILILFRPLFVRDNRDRSAFTAAILDVCICAICLGLLLGAQAERCCHEYDGGRLLAGEAQDKTSVGDDDVCGLDTETQEVLCCPTFGCRLYGGFGSIEMFTSLIVLRLLRFWAAHYIVRKLDRRYGWSERAIEEQEHQDHSPNEAIVRADHPFDPLYERKEKSHVAHSGRLAFADESGTIVDLWKSALSLYPEIVSKHGEFSGELLQAMLGVAGVDGDLVSDTSQCLKPSKSETEILPAKGESSKNGGQFREEQINPSSPRSNNSDGPEERCTDGSPGRRTHMRRRSTITSEKRFAGLAYDAQSIILSGRIGKPIRAISDESAARPSGKYSDYQFGESCDFEQFGNAALEQVPEFQVCEEFEGDGESASQFFAPNAPLIRSMRRCERKLLPLLTQWSMVDVVMTKYEIILLDASDVDDIASVTDPSPRLRHMQDVRQAVIATKGGKGLRLRDVAFGRRVVGHQEIHVIESINVERILPHSADANYDIDPSRSADEFWKESKSKDEPLQSRSNRWMYVNEDRLRLRTAHDTLFLRFYGDLDNCEHNMERMNKENETKCSIFKNNALQWCQTIGRLVGSTKLKQELPHFGDDTDDELRDYLILVEPDFDLNANAMARLKKTVSNANFIGHRRNKSDFLNFSHGNATPLRERANTAGGQGLVKPELNRQASSFGERSSSSMAKQESKVSFRRSHSLGVSDISGDVEESNVGLESLDFEKIL